MTKKVWFILGISLSLLCMNACDPYQKLLKSSDFELKKEKAQEYYNKGDYYKTIPLLEELLVVYKGTQDVEKLYYYYAYSQFGNQDYLLSAYYFKAFVESYPKSIYAEDALFMVAYSYYKMSPTVSLEQENTEKAINAFQLFVNTFPGSEKQNRSNELIDELREKLEEKYFEGAELYYRIKSYQAATTSFQNLLKRFPETKRKEEVLFLICKSNFLLAQNSVPSKKTERYQATLNAYYEFIDKYPKSKHIREAERIYATSLQYMEKVNETKTSN